MYSPFEISDYLYANWHKNLLNDSKGINASRISNLPRPALIITLQIFTATPQPKRIQLTWATSSETTNCGFRVEHATQQGEWNTLGFVRGAGQSTTLREYTYTHAVPAPGMNYYRLRQEDFDGTTTYSDVRTVDFTGADATGSLVVSPNPATDLVTIGRSAALAEAPLELVSAGGRVMRRVLAGETSLVVGDLPAGVYVLRATEEPAVATRLVVR